MLLLFQNLILQLDNGDIISIVTAVLSALVAIGLFLFERKSRISQFKRENDKTHTYELIGEFKTCRSGYPNGINSWNDFFNGYKYTDIFKQHLKTGYNELFQNLVKALQLDIDKTVAREKLVNTIKERVRLYASDL
jgi:hypothetical protein